MEKWEFQLLCYLLGRVDAPELMKCGARREESVRIDALAHTLLVMIESELWGWPCVLCGGGEADAAEIG
jgi:hypothetical protein